MLSMPEIDTNTLVLLMILATSNGGILAVLREAKRVREQSRWACEAIIELATNLGHAFETVPPGFEKGNVKSAD